MEAQKFTAAQRKAIEELLDDPSPAVRAALLAQFARYGRESVELLRSFASRPNRVLALNAYVTYPLVPEGPWGSAKKGTLEALALENPVATSQQRIDEHYLAYLAAHRRLRP